jgi:hypothetical protein
MKKENADAPPSSNKPGAPSRSNPPKPGKSVRTGLDPEISGKKETLIRQIVVARNKVSNPFKIKDWSNFLSTHPPFSLAEQQTRRTREVTEKTGYFNVSAVKKSCLHPHSRSDSWPEPRGVPVPEKYAGPAWLSSKHPPTPTTVNDTSGSLFI